MKNLLKQLNQKPIAYYPVYRQITGSTTAGILLSQLMYWFSKQDKIYKTDKEIMRETLLSESELKSAKNKIKKLDFVEVSREGLPARTYYKIDWEMYEICLGELAKQNELNPQSSAGETQRASSVKSTNPYYTENTTENTTEKKNIKKEKSQTEIYPPELNTEAFKMWIEYKGKSYSKQGRILSINKLVKYPKDIQMQMVENSIMNNYKGLFEIKPQNNQASQYQQPKQAIDPFELYTAYRSKGMSREVAETRVITETNMKYPATDRFLKATADAEYELCMQQRLQKQQQQKPMSDEEYQRKLLEEMENGE